MFVSVARVKRGGAYMRVHGRHHLSRGRALMLRTKNAYQVPLSALRHLRWDCFLRPLRASACSRGGRLCASR
jgi:hypothetical protein